jgi:hypothetical protein
MGSNSWQAGSINGNKPTVSTSTDAVKVGGFIGSMSHLMLFSYTAQIANTRIIKMFDSSVLII